MKTAIFVLGVIGFAVLASGQTASAPSPGLPWTMGAKRLQRNGDTIQANGVFINIARTCDAFAGSAVLSADDVVIKPGPNPRDRDVELTGNVHMRYTLLHD